MAYSDYGGYAYRDGERVVDRSDFTLTPEGGFGTPGSYPGFAALAHGASSEAVKQIMEAPNGHAVLGDGPIYVVLYKQGLKGVYRGMETLDILSLISDQPAGSVGRYTSSDGTVHVWLETSYYRDNRCPCVAEVDGHTLTLHFTDEDNCYVYARLEQPDGHVWHGWSGYGVGAGLEDCGYGFSTEEREAMLLRLWPDAIKPRTT